MIYLLYDILLLIAFPIILLLVATRSLRGKRRREGVGERLGIISEGKRTQLAGSPLIWVHAVSVGEAIAARPLIRGLKESLPGYRVILSTVTETGQELARTFPEIDVLLYLPFDFSPVVARVLRIVRPSCIVLMETELWPNFIRLAAQRNIPVVLANGRISDRSFGRYLKLRALFAPLLRNLTLLCMQSAEDARRITEIGAPRERVHAVGNVKYDIPASIATPAGRALLRTTYGLPVDSLVLIGASTHQGEEEALLDIWNKLRQEGHRFVPVLVPRHPERAGLVTESAVRFGWNVRLRSTLQADNPCLTVDDLLLVDTIGELGRLYALSDVAFVGGSLVPVGGHNILEPLACGTPTIFGPHMHNFREMTAMVLEQEAGIQVASAEELHETVRQLLGDDEYRRRISCQGIALVSQASGGVSRHCELIKQILHG